MNSCMFDTRTYNVKITLLYTAIADDGAFMSKLEKSLTPTLRVERREEDAIYCRTLRQHLFYWCENYSAPLTWKQRVAIALDVARGVEYLHSLAQQSFIHRDLKPSNILLDNTGVSEEMCHFASWFRGILINMENIRMTTDQTLHPDEETMESIYKVAELAGHCTAPEAHQRPNMGHAVNVLVPLVEQWKPITHQEERQGYDMINHSIYDMSFSEILSGR
ncbi:Receptor-like kinase TMK4, partial [Mucuna pruriens]